MARLYILNSVRKRYHFWQDYADDATTKDGAVVRIQDVTAVTKDGSVGRRPEKATGRHGSDKRWRCRQDT
jgi:hypothetical protein